MRVLRRSVVALCAASCLVALTACGGLGVNIGSGTSRGSQVVNSVSIQPQTGPGIDNVTFQHTILMQCIARYNYGGTSYVSSTQGCTWGVINVPTVVCDASCPPPSCPPGLGYACTTSSAFTGAIFLFDGDCVTPYNGAVTQTVCVFGAELKSLGPPSVAGTAGLTATAAGVTGQVTMNIQ